MNKFIPLYEPSITRDDVNMVNAAVSSGWVSSLGEYVDKFEKKFAEFCGVKYALATSSGTAALHLALESLGLSINDEAIIPDLTFIATANAVSYTGAKIKTVDIEENSLCIDTDAVKSAISRNTKVIIPVHLYGHPADMGQILKIAEDKGLSVIEDAAEAHGALYQGKRVGSFGNFGVFSFYGNKIITTGEGGMLTTNEKPLFEKARYLRDHAMSPKKRYWHTTVGFNYRMTNIQAALGLAQIKRIDYILKKKKRIFSLYEKEFKDIDNISLNKTTSQVTNVYWLVNIENKVWRERSRDAAIAKLKDKGIDSRPYFYPVSDMPMYKKDADNTPVSHRLYQRGISLPSSPTLTKEEIEYICNTVKNIFFN